jgi:adenylosuccinate lyase/3-carboxy-cis,cis-muconate cycloisomerase
MPTTLDCELFRDLFGSAEMRRAFDTRAMVQAWLDVEAALADAEAELGVIPEAAADRIRCEARVENFEMSMLRRGIAESQHPLVPVIRALTGRCAEHGGYVHWGATTQDIVDTGMVLQVRDALPWLMARVSSAHRSCLQLALRFASSPMAARTHGQQAVPMTFGLKAASWADELARVQVRLAGVRESVSVAQLGGAGGTLASLGDDAGRVIDAFCSRLELRRPEVPWFGARDRIRDLAHALGEVGASAERIAAEVIRLQATEVGELAESDGDARVGSSTMPQKRNPMVSEYLVASAHLLRGSIAALLNAAAHAGERDMSLWAVEWLAVPQAFILAGGIAEKLDGIVGSLEVDRARMRANLDLTEGAVLAEAAMMALARELGREEAHAIVTAASRKARAADRELLEVLVEDPRAGSLIDSALLTRLRDPAAYLGLAVDVATTVGRGESGGGLPAIEPEAAREEA